MLRRLTLLVVACLALAAANASATTIYSTFPVAATGGADLMGKCADPHVNGETANGFTVSETWSVDAYRVLVDSGSATEVNALLSLWRGASLPAEIVEGPLPFVVPDGPAVVTVPSLAHPLLGSADTYWIVLAAADGVHDSYLWLWSDVPGLHRLLRWDGDPWNDSFKGTVFDVQGTSAAAPAVPEPATLALVGLGLVGAMRRARDRRR